MPSMMAMTQITHDASENVSTPSDDGDSQHDETGGVVAQVELVDAERAQEDGQQTGGHVILRRDHRLAVRLLVVRLLIAVVRLLRSTAPGPACGGVCGAPYPGGA